MDVALAPALADGLREYVPHVELAGLCTSLGVELPLVGGVPSHAQLAIALVTRPDHGNHWRIVKALVPAIVVRAQEGVAKSDWEQRDYHRALLARLRPLEAALEAEGLPEELVVPEAQPFTAKSEVREFLGGAGTQVTLVDNYIGPSTLDCLRDVQMPIRLLTGAHGNAVADGFDRALGDFRAEGRTIDVRMHPRLHDRYIVFNDRCWLVGSSLKDAGRKSFNILEFVDAKEPVLADVERKWNEATPWAS